MIRRALLSDISHFSFSVALSRSFVNEKIKSVALGSTEPSAFASATVHSRSSFAAEPEPLPAPLPRLVCLVASRFESAALPSGTFMLTSNWLSSTGSFKSANKEKPGFRVIWSSILVAVLATPTTK